MDGQNEAIKEEAIKNAAQQNLTNYLIAIGSNLSQEQKEKVEAYLKTLSV